MGEPDRFALDASVGVKWFKRESGSELADELYERAVARDIQLIAPTHFFHEVLSVVQRELTTQAITEAWGHLQAAGILMVPLSDAAVAEAVRQGELLGCSFYDALAPACAVLLEATLASADERAHGAFPEVFLVR